MKQRGTSPSIPLETQRHRHRKALAGLPKCEHRDTPPNNGKKGREIIDRWSDDFRSAHFAILLKTIVLWQSLT